MAAGCRLGARQVCCCFNCGDESGDKKKDEK